MATHTTVWDIARIGSTAGVEIHATFHPDRITARMRNAIKRMVMGGELKGSWQSQAKRLARALCDKYGVPYNNNGRDVTVPSHTPENIRNQLIDLLKADEVAMRMEEGRLHPYYVDLYERDRRQLEVEHLSHAVRFNDSTVREEALTLMRHSMQQFDSERRKALCDMLDGTDPIELRVPSY